MIAFDVAIPRFHFLAAVVITLPDYVLLHQVEGQDGEQFTYAGSFSLT